jgi:hypothetical protein
MKDATNGLLLGAFQFLEKQQQSLQQVMIATYALRQTVRELGPEAEALYRKHYSDAKEGPIKLGGDQTLKALAQLIQQLSELD